MSIESRLSMRVSALVLAPAMLLRAACGGDDEEFIDSADSDGLEASALGDDIMYDPDLAGQNGANSALSGNLRSGVLAPEDLTPEAKSLARSEALALVGGPGSIRSAPEASEASNASLSGTLAEAATPGGNEDCAKDATFSAQWGARLPEVFPVYPRGSVQEAAGNDQGSCSLRVVTFQSALPLDDVLDFYYTRAFNAGFSAEHSMDAEYDVMGGARGEETYLIFARDLPQAGSEITLITNGG